MHVFAVAAFAQPRLQFLAAGRKHEDAERVRHFFFHLALTLNVNIQQHIAAVLMCLFQNAARRAVVVAENLGVFQELSFADHFLEFFPADEMVFAPVLLAAARWTRGVRNGKPQIGDILAQFVHQGGLARAGGR